MPATFEAVASNSISIQSFEIFFPEPTVGITKAIVDAVIVKYVYVTWIP